jgi:hypothetical protein
MDNQSIRKGSFARATRKGQGEHPSFGLAHMSKLAYEKPLFPETPLLN